MTWPTARLGDICRMQSGGTPRRGQPGLYEGSVPWAKIGDLECADGVVMTTEETITEAGLAAIGNRLFPQGTILLAMYGSVGKTGIAGRPMATNQAILGITPLDPSRVDARFLRRWLDASQAQFVRAARGATQPNISKALVESVEAPVPPISDQRRIADILDKADALRRRRKQAVGLTGELMRSAFIEVFGDPAINLKRWEVKPFGAIVRETRLGLVRGAAEQGPDKQWPYVRMNAIRPDGRLELDSVTRVDATDAERETTLLRDGDFLFNTRNSRELVGKAAVFHGAGEFLFNNNIMRVRFVDGVEPDFVAAYWLTAAAQRELDSRKAGTTSVFAIYYKDLATLPVPVPPMSEQRKYALLCRQVRAALNRQSEALRASTELFNSLSAQAFDPSAASGGER